ncbi:hypothetical protein DEO72_LG8g1560 [Vigna unguiculata]|uniref:Transposase (putative) gypsy type domain-containing protein n=1 Tax=Vigna unguiculata TaxID=3917 RepID=A0A4D6MUF1_VIGUN|nr:hypothetical protein DEO72_LG8g1560 [Vigna unguiculata]
MGCRSRMTCVGELAKPARCDTPVPQPLSVVNSVKAWKCQKVGERMSGGHIVRLLAPSFLMRHIFHNDGVAWSGVSFWREEFKSFGIADYKYGFECSRWFTWFICEFRNQRSCAHHLVRLVPKFRRHLSVKNQTSMSSSDSSSLSTSSSSQSTESDRSRDDRLHGEGVSAGVGTSGVPREVVREIREDPPEELEESNWPAKGGYAWVASDVRDQSSLFRWSRLLNSWLNCTPVISRGVSGDIVSLERVSAIDRVCHGQEGAAKKFFYMYMCHFSQLHIRLPFDDFTMGVLRALNVAPTQLHPNSWAYLQAFRILCESLYLEPSPYAFLYFYDTRPRRPATWLSLISRPSISRLDAFSQSFKHFKDGYFKVVVQEGGEQYFLNADGSTKFPFSWTNNPSRYKDMGVEELSSGDKEGGGMLLRFVDKLPTKGLVRVYNSVHPIIDIEGHMAQSGKKNLALFQALRKKMAAKAKEAGKVDVPNLQESVVEVHVHGGTKRKAELPPRPGKGKDVKKVRAAILGSSSGAGSASGEKLPEAGLIELPEISDNG